MENEIVEYENQLKQVKLAIESLPDGPEKQNLTALEADLIELIKLSRTESCQSSGVSTSQNDPFFDEYNLFKAEISQIDKETCETQVEDERNNKEEAKINLFEQGLEGTKCQAPFLYKWADNVTYHNAFICQVPFPRDDDKINNIEVKVMFTNPTHEEMLPCPYYLEGNCKFTDDKCKYSHGQLVPVNMLKEYREPAFSELSEGAQVLAKQNDQLWHRAVVINVNENICHVKFESISKEDKIPLHNIFPLGNGNPKSRKFSDSDDDSDTDCEFYSGNMIYDNDGENDVIKKILENPPGAALGEWEKFTKGVASKIMEKMGYVHGSGLGKDGMGRVEPVPAVIFPPGKSLDHCMMLKNKAGNSKDLLKAERKMKKKKQKHEEQMKKAYINEKNKQDIFQFLNTKLCNAKEKGESSPKTNVKKVLKNESTRNLNVTSLQLSEEVRKVEKEIKSLNQSLTRHSPNSHAFSMIKEKLTSKKTALSELYASETKIKNEQSLRRERKKLTVF